MARSEFMGDLSLRRLAAWVPCIGTILIAPFAGCAGSGLASLGGDTAGGRGQVGVIFINNTPNRAVFTAGTYDQLDPASVPDFAQFGLDDVGAKLEANAHSGLVELDCAHVFSVGGPRMLNLLNLNRPGADVEAAALVEGVQFFKTDENGNLVDAGSATAFEALLGADFPCGALLIVYLEVDEAGPSPFRVDFQLIPSQSSR